MKTTKTSRWENFQKNLEVERFLFCLIMGAIYFSLPIALPLTILVGAGAKFFLISTALFACVGVFIGLFSEDGEKFAIWGAGVSYGIFFLEVLLIFLLGL